ncbi:MAG: HEAT repeat domain-containing protein [Candidatus Omnitrophica bacterium]|nr:HEAT repeat domain-containing protein [Candidatus Omnitrophota bacterium]
MYNYHADLIWVIDRILFFLVILLGLFTIFYSLAQEYYWKKRARTLLNIKRNIYELVSSGKRSDNKVCLPIVSEITQQQFLDVATNRNREVVFFNEAEQNILKECFVSVEKLAAIEKTAVSSWSKWRRVEAILTLGYAQIDSSVNTLKKTINDLDTDISYFSIIALGQIKNIPSARILLDFIRKRLFYRYRILSLLESFPSEIATEVIGLVNNMNHEIRSWSVKLICKLKASQYSDKIEELTRDKSAQVRACATDCLGEFGSKDSAGAIVKCLADDSWMVRVSSVKALFKVLGKNGLPEIMSRINDGSLSVIESVKALMTENIDLCLSYVEKFLYGNDEIARRVCVESLEASGYIIKLFRNILTAEHEKDKDVATGLLKGLIISRAYAGLQGSLLILSADERSRLLDIIRYLDKAAANILEKDIAGDKG